VGGRILNMILKKIAAFLLAAVVSVTFGALAFAQEYDDPEIELTPEFDNEVFDDEGDYPVEFTIGFGTHTKMPDGTSAKLVLYAGVGCEIEGMDENDERIYGYSSIASDKYVCKTSANGGYYPNYGETVRLKPFDNTCPFKAELTISDKDGNVIHKKEMQLYILKRDGVIAISDEGYDDAEQKLDKPLYKLLLFLKTPLGTAVKIVLFVLLIGIAYLTLNYKSVRRKIRQRRADKQQRKEGN